MHPSAVRIKLVFYFHHRPSRTNALDVHFIAFICKDISLDLLHSLLRAFPLKDQKIRSIADLFQSTKCKLYPFARHLAGRSLCAAHPLDINKKSINIFSTCETVIQ